MYCSNVSNHWVRSRSTNTSEMSIIYWSQGAGLANRLRAIVGYRAMSQVLGKPFYLCWVPDVYCNAKFETLFSTPSDVELISLDQKDALELKSDSSVYVDHDWFNEIWKRHLSDVIGINEFAALANQSLRQLCPTSSIQEKLDGFAQRHAIQNAFGLHIRSTDNIEHYQQWGDTYSSFRADRVSTLDGFECFIQDISKQHEGAKFFLATDNQQLERQLKRSYPNQIITYPKKFIASGYPKIRWKQLRIERQLQRTSSIEDALIELLLLAKCKMIVGTYWSSYSYLSACLGYTANYFEIHGSQYVPHQYVEKLRGNIPF